MSAHTGVSCGEFLKDFVDQTKAASIGSITVLVEFERDLFDLQAYQKPW